MQEWGIYFESGNNNFVYLPKGLSLKIEENGTSKIMKGNKINVAELNDRNDVQSVLVLSSLKENS